MDIVDFYFKVFRGVVAIVLITVAVVAFLVGVVVAIAVGGRF